MRMEDSVVFWSAMLVALIVVPWLTFAMASLIAGFPKLRIHQLLGMVAVAAWIFAFTNFSYNGGNALLVFATVVLVLIGFAVMWAREFPLLMIRRSDEFPDRLDKLVWVFLLTLIAPAGVWLFRSYRRTRWPDVAEAIVPRHPLDGPDEVEVPEGARVGA